ncbi:MAG: protein-L-isoaspartate(D-aspartate) O-methyltransferase [Rhodobacteraceae bacterium]|nr:protein-L-isoaspartate(D-aspartate) O-methyltransferase [Paracoccaceae bacterium]
MKSLIEVMKDRGINDQAVLEAIEKVDRINFVPEAFKHCAYSDMPVPIGSGQTISQPSVVGLMTKELEVENTHRVLEIGTGSGYLTAVLSHLAKHVYSVERIKRLHLQAKNLILNQLKRRNISFVLSDGMLGLPDAAPFDRIIISAASKEVPRKLLNQLKVNGIMVLPVVENEWQQKLVIIKKTEPEIEFIEIGPVRFVPLLEGVVLN